MAAEEDLQAEPERMGFAVLQELGVVVVVNPASQTGLLHALVEEHFRLLVRVRGCFAVGVGLRGKLSTQSAQESFKFGEQRVLRYCRYFTTEKIIN